jgi:hypothetical protein
MKTLLKLEGVPKIFLRNAVPVDIAKDYVDDYELTPGSTYEWDEDKKQVRIIDEPWTITDDEGKKTYSLFPASVVVSLIKQMVQVLGL